ncbi:hypothetical protein ACRYK1_25595, partial [Escherichia coli]|uniref:hypothetical protein n=1 Tax=Escherichia coli TaxID=562 RepID=UPI003D925280
EKTRLRGFSLSEIYVLEQNFSTSFSAFTNRGNLPANLAAWAQSINDVQAWLVSFLIQHTSVDSFKIVFRTASEAPSLLTSPYKTLQNQKFRILYIQKRFLTTYTHSYDRINHANSII